MGNDKYNFIYFNSFLFVYDLNWNQISIKRINFLEGQSYSEVISNPKHKTSKQIYLPEYMELNPISISDSISIIHVTAAHEQLNKYYHKEYYSTIKTFAKLNVFTGTVESIFGDKSEKLTKYNLLPNFDHSYFTFKSDTLIVSHEVESKLTYYSITGEKVKEMEIGDNYKVGESLPERIGIEADDYYFSDRSIASYYTYVYYDNDKGILYRVLKTGSNKDAISKYDNPTILQVIKDNKIIQEIEVSGRFRIIGKINDKIYADGIIIENESNTSLGIYKLKYR